METMCKNEIRVDRLDKILNINIIEPYNPVFLEFEKLRVARMSKFDFITIVSDDNSFQTKRRARFLNYGD
jgi:hypothetical protein